MLKKSQKEHLFISHISKKKNPPCQADLHGDFKMSNQRLCNTFFKAIKTKVILYQDCITCSNFLKSGNLKFEKRFSRRKAIKLSFFSSFFFNRVLKKQPSDFNLAKKKRQNFINHQFHIFLKLTKI